MRSCKSPIRWLKCCSWSVVTFIQQTVFCNIIVLTSNNSGLLTNIIAGCYNDGLQVIITFSLKRPRTMSLNKVPSGKDLPNDFNVIIEIPMHGEPVKYEVDKESGAIFVDRFMNTAMHYPCNYGYIPHTLSDDGDPVDVLVITPVPLNTGVVVRCRPLAVLKMEDESGFDAKVLAVPVDKLSTLYRGLKNHSELPPIVLKQISH